MDSLTKEHRRELKALAREEKRAVKTSAKAQRLAERQISNLKSQIAKEKVSVNAHLKLLARRRKILEGRLNS
jgi:vacuolar-type H+-ATPase subunit E/Vma4